MNVTRTTLREALWRWQRGIARACRWRHDGAVIPGKKRSLSAVIVPHLLLTLLLVLAFASPAQAALSRISSASAAATSVAITTPNAGYLERQVQATISKCKDPMAAGPRFACG